jgi:GAF domain-containing protein
MLVDGAGELAVVASTSEHRHLVDLMQLRAGYGPSVECFLTGEVVSIADLAHEASRWPEFDSGAIELGYKSVFVFPLRLRGSIIGSLALFRSTASVMSAEDISIAQGLADVATIGILHERAIRESDLAKEQLQRALNSRVIIEQAKGVLAQTRSVDMDEAFAAMRAYARTNGIKLHDVAERIVSRTLSL